MDNVMKVAGEAYRMKTGDQTGCGDDVFWLAPLCPLRSKITKLATESHSQFAGLDPHIKSFFFCTQILKPAARERRCCVQNVSWGILGAVVVPIYPHVSALLMQVAGVGMPLEILNWFTD